MRLKEVATAPCGVGRLLRASMFGSRVRAWSRRSCGPRVVQCGSLGVGAVRGTWDTKVEGLSPDWRRVNAVLEPALDDLRPQRLPQPLLDPADVGQGR